MNLVKTFEVEAAGNREYVPLEQLQRCKDYAVENIRFIDTRYGRGLAVDLEGYQWSILPRRLATLVVDQDQLNQLVMRRYTLRYLGADDLQGGRQLVKLTAENRTPLAAALAAVAADIAAEASAEAEPDIEIL